MALEAIYSFLTYPKKSVLEDAVIKGTEVPIGTGKLCRMLGDIFDSAQVECSIPIMFVSSGETQHNPVREELLALMVDPKLSVARPLAVRLQDATSGTSGMGLLFICVGLDGDQTRVVVSRFPADEGVMAEHSSNQLTVKFVEQVFLKSAYSYKAATFVSSNRPNDLWKGHVVDKQLNHGSKSVADYWIVDFLAAELSTTAAAGTKRLASALRMVMATTADLAVKQEITAAVSLAKNMPVKALAIVDFCDYFHFSKKTKEAILAKVNPSRLVNEKFRFDATEFARIIAFKQVELDNGAILTAETTKFDRCFKDTVRGQKHTFTTTGRIVDERLRKTK